MEYLVAVGTASALDKCCLGKALLTGLLNIWSLDIFIVRLPHEGCKRLTRLLIAQHDSWSFQTERKKLFVARTISRDVERLKVIYVKEHHCDSSLMIIAAQYEVNLMCCFTSSLLQTKPTSCKCFLYQQ